MAAESVGGRRRRGAVVAAAAALLMTVMALAVPVSSYAAEAVSVCNPTATNGCVNGILQDSSKKAIAGAKVTLSGKESATTTTDKDGKWAFSVGADGKYTVAPDPPFVSQYGLQSSTAVVSLDKNSYHQPHGAGRFAAANPSD